MYESPAKQVEKTGNRKRHNYIYSEHIIFIDKKENIHKNLHFLADFNLVLLEHRSPLFHIFTFIYHT